MVVFTHAVSPAIALTEEQRLVAEVWRFVDRAYVDDTFNHQNWWLVRQKAMKQPLNDMDQAYGVIQQMLASLEDPFTRLLKPDQYRSLQTNTSGELTGVGLQIALDNDTGELKVIAPIAGSPAAEAGILPADTILKIDGASTSGLSLDEAAERMRGPVGSKVLLTIRREGKELADLSVRRDRIELNPVYADLRLQPAPTASDVSKKIGYIRLSQFNANAAMEVAHALHRLEQQGAEAYVLDLRSNPGGLLQAGIEIARYWLDSGTIVYTVNRQGIEGSFEATGQALTHDPLVVLVNQGTASASEILAGALKDNGRATIMGERTFGKGLIQSLFDLSDGSGLAVTVARYETPDHIDINKQGIKPDITVPLDPIAMTQLGTQADRQYETAMEFLATHTMVAGAA
ncbi:MAG: S41 family peptidase [Leptolyngbyaceae cyanobacterium bins.349]|nr:S41 family peptidase [Leptolyngbyaceae cyanobacterium bins.349]